MELFNTILPFAELLFLLAIGQAFAVRLFGQQHSNTPNWDVINYALLNALPVYVVTSSLALSLAEFATSTVIRFLQETRLIESGHGQWIGLATKIVWVVLLAFEIPVLME